MEEQNDILIQRKEYRPTELPEEEKESVQEFSNDANKIEEEGKGNVVSELLKDKKKLLIIAIAGVAGVIFLLLGLSIPRKGTSSTEEELMMHADELLDEGFEPDYRYTDEETQMLREAGYTGWEIEDFAFDEIDAQLLINAASDARKAKYEKELLPYLSGASDEFKELYTKTWVGQDSFEIPNDDELTWRGVVENVNADYEKITASGTQCIVKCTLPNLSTVFIFIRPERYRELEDKGNMVLRLEYIIMSNGTSVVVNAEEIIP